MTRKLNISLPEFVIMMATLISLTALSIDMTLPALGLIGDDLNATHPNTQQYIISCLFMGLTFGQLFYGPFADSYGRKSAIYIGVIVFIVGSLFSIFAETMTMMLIGRTLQGVGVAGTRVISVATVRDCYAGDDMARIMSIIMAVFILVPAAAPGLGQLVLLFMHWRSIFVILLIVSMFLLIWVGLRLPETLAPENKREFKFKPILKGMKEVFANPTTRTYTFCRGLSFSILVGYLTSSQQIFQNYFDTGEMFAVYFAILALFIGAASLVNARVISKFGMQKITEGALLILAGISLIYITYLLTNENQSSLLAFMLFAIGVFVSLGFLFGNFNAMAMEPMGHMAGIASAVIGFVSSAISVSIGTIIGQMYNQTIIPLTAAILCIVVVTFILQYRLNRDIIKL